MTVSAVYGLGNHESVLSHSDIVKTNLWSWLAQIVAILCLVVARFAVISFLLAIQERTQKRTYQIGRRLILFVGILQGLINVAEVVLILEQCDPVQKLWDPTVPGTCTLIKTCSQVGYFQGSVGVFADLVLACYPIYIFTRLHQELRVKIGLCLIMGGGVMYEASFLSCLISRTTDFSSAAIAGICKTIAISSITSTSDITYAIHSLNTWVLTEMWFIIIFGSIPVLRAFFVRFARTVTTSPDYQFERTSRTVPLDGSHTGKNNWISLNEASNAWTTCEPSTETTYNPGDAESEENILPEDLRNGKITVTKTTQVQKENR